MVSGVLARKLRRDIWRQRGQFASVAVVVALGVTVFIAATDAYQNLKASFDRAYALQRLPDAVIAGPGAHELARQAADLPGTPAVAVRSQADVGGRIGDHALLIRVVTVPEASQPPASLLAVRSGRLPAAGEVLVEQHLADHFGLAAGATIQIGGPTGWRTVAVSGSGLSTEYFWPARSRQEVITSAEHFGVVFTPEATAAALGIEGEQQVALYARDRERAGELASAATSLGRSRGLVVTLRSDQPSYVALDEDVRTFGEFAKLLPALFLVAGMLGGFIVLSRLVHAQRAVIGTLNASGIPAPTIRRHYLGFGLVAGIAAAGPGAAGGYLLGAWFTTRYTDAIGLPLHVVSLRPMTMIVGAGAGLAASLLAAWAPARAAARIAPAEAMRIAPSGRGRTSLGERLLPPLRRLPARWRMVARGLARNRRRAALTVAGVVASLSLVIVFAGLRDTVTAVLDRQFGEIDGSDGQLHAADGNAVTALAGARADPDVDVAEPFARAEATLASQTRTYDTLVLALPTATRLHHFVDARGDPLALPPDGGVLLGLGLRRLLDIEVGDSVAVGFTAGGTQLRERVAGFVDEPMSAVAYVSLEHLDATLGRSTATGALVRLRPGADRDAAAHRLGALPGAAAYLDNASLDATMRDAFAMIDVLVGVMLAFAAVMAAALLFNAMSANVAERAVELGTLHAAGISRRMLVRLVAAENLLLTSAAIPVGLAVGTLLARWFMSGYENLGYRWALRMQPETLVMVAAGVAVASLVSQLPVLRAVRNIDVARIVRERSM